jgi:hypothetical protein
MIDWGEVHVVVTLSTITIYGFTEEWVMLFLLCLPLLFKFWQRSGSCCCCYVFYHYCLMFDRGVVHVVVVILSTITVLGNGWKYSHPKQYEPLLCQTVNSKGRQYNSNNMNHSSVIPKTVMVDNITTTTWTTPLSNLEQ